MLKVTSSVLIPPRIVLISRFFGISAIKEVQGSESCGFDSYGIDYVLD
jgi:hypothetical protein